MRTHSYACQNGIFVSIMVPRVDNTLRLGPALLRCPDGCPKHALTAAAGIAVHMVSE